MAKETNSQRRINNLKKIQKYIIRILLNEYYLYSFKKTRNKCRYSIKSNDNYTIIYYKTSYIKLMQMTYTGT